MPIRIDNKQFVADVAAFAEMGKERMEDTMRTALSDMINDMQKREKDGGRMRVDTGFLRASGRGQIGSMPSGPSQKPADAPTGQYTGIYDNWNGKALVPTLYNMKLGDTFYWGWVAAYAPVREVYDLFMDGALQNWQGYVNTAVKKATDAKRT